MMKLGQKVIHWVGMLVFSVACAQTQPRLSVMTYNVENLFDTKDDAGKNDETYLPKTSKLNQEHQRKCQKVKVPKWRAECLDLDWNDAILAQKIDRISRVLREAANRRGADIVFLQEVENLAVLNDLLKRGGLDALGYRAVLIEGSDIRGIDVALITKLPVMDAKLFPIPFKNIGNIKGDTRGVLRVTVAGPEETVFSLLVVHFPAPFHPTSLRVEALDFLNKLAKAESALGRVVIAAGDFNITIKEETENKILDPYFSNWRIAHREGCKKCRGTTYYAKDKTWSFLDQIWIYKPHAKWDLDVDSIRTMNVLPEQSDLKPPYNPLAFTVGAEGKISEGVSDHWPLYLELKSVSKTR